MRGKDMYMVHIMSFISEGSWEKRWNVGDGLMGDLDGEGLRVVSERSLDSWRGWHGERMLLMDCTDL